MVKILKAQMQVAKKCMYPPLPKVFVLQKIQIENSNIVSLFIMRIVFKINAMLQF